MFGRKSAILLLCTLVAPHAALAAAGAMTTQARPEAIATAPALPSGFAAVSASAFAAKRRPRLAIARPFRPLAPEVVMQRVTGLGLNLGNLGNATGILVEPDPNATLQYAMWDADLATFGPANAVGGHVAANGGLQVSFQGVPGTTYLLDCAVQDNVTYTVIAGFNGLDAIKGTQTSSGGHILIPFQKAPAAAVNNAPTAVIFGPGFDFGGCQVNTVQ